MKFRKLKHFYFREEKCQVSRQLVKMSRMMGFRRKTWSCTMYNKHFGILYDVSSSGQFLSNVKFVLTLPSRLPIFTLDNYLKG